MGIKNVKQYNKRPSYPYVGLGICGGLVLFIGPHKGLVISLGTGAANNGIIVGFYTEDWDEPSFTPIEYTVTFDLS